MFCRARWAVLCSIRQGSPDSTVSSSSSPIPDSKDLRIAAGCPPIPLRTFFQPCRSSSDSSWMPRRARWKCSSSITPKGHPRIRVVWLVGQVVNLRADWQSAQACAGSQPARRIPSCPTWQTDRLPELVSILPNGIARRASYGLASNPYDMSNPEEKDRIALLQGTLDLLILRILVFGPQHGQGIARSIQLNSEDVLLVDHGALYPALQRLEARKWISAEWGV